MNKKSLCKNLSSCSSPTNFEALTDELEFPNGNWKQWWYKTGPILLKLMTSSNYIASSGSTSILSSTPVSKFSYPEWSSCGVQCQLPAAWKATNFSQSIHLDATEKVILQEIKINDTFLRAQTLFGIDFVGDGAISVKAYSSRGLLVNMVQGLQRQVDCSELFSMVDCYLQETNSYNPYTFFSWDCIKLSNSRLKLYMCSASMMRAKLEDAWSLGSRLQGPSVEKGLYEDPSPLTKIYLPVHGENDQKIATGVAHFIEEIGMVDTGKTYLDTIQTYFPRHDLEQTDRLASWISFAFTEITGLYLSTHYHSSLTIHGRRKRSSSHLLGNCENSH
ncbi:tryptophan dimethylallyltransferase-domain-containing protein [Aspergillus arachidicola]|uniref:Tryptophan dimethylallyltransferase-domain-containing protein n=1 Tax=Aspergillus arachidicola TaxID=656916 RepID=A0A5N6YEU2_9EURO|nr:tryptophan dimethylallyltransferase-domain-containing protein [Aspergillus arachidicola]